MSFAELKYDSASRVDYYKSERTEHFYVFESCFSFLKRFDSSLLAVKTQLTGGSGLWPRSAFESMALREKLFGGT